MDTDNAKKPPVYCKLVIFVNLMALFMWLLTDFLQRVGLEIKSSAAYRRVQEMVTYIENIYRDFTEKSKRENLEKYYTMIVDKLYSGAQVVIDRGEKATYLLK